MSFTLFQVPIPITGNRPGFEGFGKIGLEGISPRSAPIIFGTIISNIIGFLTVIAGLWFLFQIVISGIRWISAGGDKQKLAEAQGKITNSVIGLTIVVIAIFIVRLIADLLGISIIFIPFNAISTLVP